MKVRIVIHDVHIDNIDGAREYLSLVQCGATLYSHGGVTEVLRTACSGSLPSRESYLKDRLFAEFMIITFPVCSHAACWMVRNHRMVSLAK